MFKSIFSPRRVSIKLLSTIERQLNSSIRRNGTWSDASTVMLISKSDNHKQHDNQVNGQFNYNYRVLMVKRSTKSSFMPDAYVFPGGKADKEDFDESWWELISNENIDNDNRDGHKELMTLKQMREEFGEKNYLRGDLAMKVAGIRELFEEAGVLLLKKSSSSEGPTSSQIEMWRNRLLRNESSFSLMCSKLKLNVNEMLDSLYEWSNWLTPEIERKRFDTIFYLAFLDQKPDAVLDNNEVFNLRWVTPDEILLDSIKGSIKLAPPQVYELSKLRRITDFDQLKQFASQRHCLGTQLLLPKLVFLIDKQEANPNQDKKDKFNVLKVPSFVCLLPGDDCFHDDKIGHQVSSFDQLLCHNMNRVSVNRGQITVMCNIKLPLNQLSPLPFIPHESRQL